MSRVVDEEEEPRSLAPRSPRTVCCRACSFRPSTFLAALSFRFAFHSQRGGDGDDAAIVGRLDDSRHRRVHTSHSFESETQRDETKARQGTATDRRHSPPRRSAVTTRSRRARSVFWRNSKFGSAPLAESRGRNRKGLRRRMARRRTGTEYGIEGERDQCDLRAGAGGAGESRWETTGDRRRPLRITSHRHRQNF